MLKRIQFLVEKGLMSMMVLFDFLSKRIAPLQHHACLAWMYIRENDTTQLEHDHGSELDPKVLEGMLSKMTHPLMTLSTPRRLVCESAWTGLRGCCY
jgi:hypothetical protein